MKQDLAKRYDPSGIEGPLYEEWERFGLFHVEAEGASDPYVIVIPPPNVTAPLHMGHGLNNTIQDVLIRWRRMQGRDALWVPGTDHAGIATQNVVERQLANEGSSRADLGRAGFVDRVWAWVEEYGGRIIEQLKSIGCSCDWARTRFTLDEGLSRAVREVFVRLYEKELVYRGRYIINWCPRCGTALSNEEAEHREVDGKLYHIRYPLAGDPESFVQIATTRPETMLGDTGLAVHPEDERYVELIGQEATLPLVGRSLPIVADDYVDPEFGSGMVKVTPAHDPNDFEIALRHDLPAIDVMTGDGRMSDEAPEAYRGLDRFEARERVIEDLRKADLITGIDEHRHSVGRCYRCDTIVEPRLSTQWFVRMAPLAEPSLAAYRDGELKFHPERFGRVYAHWLENIRDWCISRQLWWGHRIPVWYCRSESCGKMVVTREDPDACPSCGGPLEQDPDVLDTWFSSWLWPFSTLGWPEETADLATFYPTHTLVTAADILFFWVARMVMAGLEFRGELPFTDVVINGTVRDHRGRRMSKTLGNGIDPLEVVDMFGADAMRFTLVRAAPVGTDLNLNYEDLEETFRPGRNFANKIWNAARFALPHLEGMEPAELDPGALELADRWILSRFHSTARDVTEAFEAFRLHEAAERLHAFVWGDFCDWYLELIKDRLDGSRGELSRSAATRTMAQVMDGWLRLLHPIMPFLSETLARRLPRAEAASLVSGPWPDPPSAWDDPESEERLEAARELIGIVRNLRADYKVPPGSTLDARLEGGSTALHAALDALGESAARLAGMRLDRGAGPGSRTGVGVVAVLTNGAELFLQLEGVIDIEKEKDRLEAEARRLDDLLAGVTGRLSNDTFLAKAPTDVVQRERDKQRSLSEQRDLLLEKLGALEPGS